MGRRIEANQFEHRRSGEGAQRIADAAENGNEDELARLGPIGEFRRRDLLGDGDQHAADAAQRRRDDVADQQDAAGGDAEIFQPRLVGLDRAQHVAGRAFQETLHGEGGRDRDRERQVEQYYWKFSGENAMPNTVGRGTRMPSAPLVR